jgi:hypothetical protein
MTTLPITRIKSQRLAITIQIIPQAIQFPLYCILDMEGELFSVPTCPIY